MSAKLYFRYGAMNSGKSTALLQVAFNYHERNMRVVIVKPTVDTKSNQVVSRVSFSGDVDWPVDNNSSLLGLFSQDVREVKNGDRNPLSCILIDEAQFLTRIQVDELFSIVVNHNVPVIAYGLRTDFQTNVFEGSLRLIELAHSIDELKTICRCGSKAMFNARKVNEVFVTDGDTVAIDGDVEYESLCGSCYEKHVRPFVDAIVIPDILSEAAEECRHKLLWRGKQNAKYN